MLLQTQPPINASRAIPYPPPERQCKSPGILRYVQGKVDTKSIHCMSLKTNRLGFFGRSPRGAQEAKFHHWEIIFIHCALSSLRPLVGLTERIGRVARYLPDFWDRGCQTFKTQSRVSRGTDFDMFSYQSGVPQPHWP